MRFFKLITLLYIVLFVSCKKEKNETVSTLPPYFAFGTVDSQCITGNCATFYSMKNGKIYTDNMDRFADQLSFTDTTLSDDKYQKAKILAEHLPAYFLEHPNYTFGFPNSYYQGLIYIEYEKDNNQIHWTIDTRVEKQPKEIRNYIAELYSVMSQLK